jgi:flavin reductase (DIM6/NTAB) family NADH-FMN oxidoreductase RutF
LRVEVLRFDPAGLATREIYALMIGAIVPRPIAFVSTLSPEGVANCAPFSYFMGVSSRPPILALSVGVRRDGRPKDTAANIRATEEFVVNVVDGALAERCVRASAEVEPEVDEFELAGLAKLPSELVRPPRIAESPVQMECRLERCLEIGAQPQFLILGEVLRFHVAERVWKDGAIDQAALDPVGRLGGELYARQSELFRIARPR